MAGTKMFSRMNYQVLRGFGELLSEATLTEREWQTIKRFFGGRCAFCNITDTGNPRTGIIPDHLIPARMFGALCLGNVVPACQACNDQRGKMDWKLYLRRFHAAAASKRIRKIQAYLVRYPYASLPDQHASLTTSERRTYGALLKSWHAIWKRAKRLRDRIACRRRKEKES